MPKARLRSLPSFVTAPFVRGHSLRSLAPSSTMWDEPSPYPPSPVHGSPRRQKEKTTTMDGLIGMDMLFRIALV